MDEFKKKAKYGFYVTVICTALGAILWVKGLLWIAGVALALVVLARFAAWAVLPQRRLTADRVRYLDIRLRLRLHPGRGHMTIVGLFTRFGRLAMFSKSRRIRPDLGAWQRWRNPDAYSTVVGRAHYRYPVRLDLQTQSAWLSVPRTGKTGALARRIIHHPGCVVATSSQPDLYKLSSGARVHRGSVVHVLNPLGLASVESTLRWDVVSGCASEVVAARRADALVNSVPTGGADGGDWFRGKAADAMRAMLVAGGLAGYDFRTVSRWILRGQIAEPVQVLEAHGKEEMAASLRELGGKAERTASTVLMFMTKAIQFASDPELLLSVLPGEGAGLDLEKLIRNGESLYLIAPDQGDDNPLSGLFSALVAEVHATAMRVAASMPGGRITPGALYVLDEFTQVCGGIPVARWAADAGGRGVSLAVVAHGVAQLEARLGKPTTRALLDVCTAKVVYGGTSDPDTLKMLEVLCGEIALKEHGRDSHARHPILSQEMLRQLPDGYALLVVGNSRPVIVRPQMAWKNALYRRLRRSGKAVAALAPAAPPKPMTTNGHRTQPTVTLPDLKTYEAPWRAEQ
jgi:type IV secretion system protein VirD4